MAHVSNHASHCIIAPSDAQEFIESVSQIHATDVTTAVNVIVSKFPESDIVKQHLGDLLNGSGNVDIRYDANATKWSVQRLEPGLGTFFF